MFEISSFPYFKLMKLLHRLSYKDKGEVIKSTRETGK